MKNRGVSVGIHVAVFLVWHLPEYSGVLTSPVTASSGRSHTRGPSWEAPARLVVGVA